jgi:hypothetical protein
MAENVGFEPTDPFESPTFEAGALSQLSQLSEGTTAKQTAEMVRPGRFKLPTWGLEGPCSIH